MEYIGNLQKMEVSLAEPIKYWLLLGNNRIYLNDYLGKNVFLNHTGLINCITCGKAIKKSYQHGYCFPCTQKLAQCDICILKPELCHHRKGTCRESDWGDIHCFSPHKACLCNKQFSGRREGEVYM